MIFYALEQREKRRKQREAQQKLMIEEALREGIDLVFAKWSQDPDASIEDVRRAVEAARKEAD